MNNSANRNIRANAHDIHYVAERRVVAFEIITGQSSYQMRMRGNAFK